ncbi:lipid-A-disaccharide synthase [Niveispirillum lacus]|uniref:Lipid-A-disaccharide synthase n=1 Tax=Niveispirillum lacus TaxID=1981099 RepID=A0A255YWD5_9PROT|nr:lipid-A-disaccharide synthase [Niveispirillum lacus]OYQ33491.1 lipid-A-disaccharide synthase [Niveispirillum lacus]
MTGPLIYLVAGEPSGDVLGARLMAALKQAMGGQVRFAGIGGERMIAEGLVSLFPMEELTLFGLAELLPKLPHLIRRIGQTAGDILACRPDAVITVDAPDFCFRVLKKVRRADASIKLIHYVAPTVWAWRPGRARKIAQFLDHLLVLLPFEPPYFEAVGLPATFVGHSIVEAGVERGDAAAFRARHDLAADTPLLCVLPGSRRSEIKVLLPDFAATLAILKERHPGLTVVVPTLGKVAAPVRAAAAVWPVPAIVVEGDGEKYDAMAASIAALAASGTVALELALARLPSVIAYRIHPLTFWLYRRLIRVKFANLVNIMLGRMLVPECLQDDCTPQQLADAVTLLLTDAAARRQQVDGVAQVAQWLGQGGGKTPSQRAAATVLDLVDKARVGSQPECRGDHAMSPGLNPPI